MKKTMTLAEFNYIIKVAKKAVKEKIENGNFDFNGGTCGWAFVVIPGRGKFTTYAKEYLKAKPHHRKGYTISSQQIYDAKGTQNIDIYETICTTFANVLKEYNINAYALSRID